MKWLARTLVWVFGIVLLVIADMDTAHWSASFVVGFVYGVGLGHIGHQIGEWFK